ncbi:hypothetical protein DY000_02031229 [Brassica cretica]|uniref:ENT domain-containing protein n=1 Tax=Brassica cretica TaxID=69181 RepID=A0ABQ7DMG7_BRACR|nr:hypothetical protein DY000_02031229 [Brassica cretica]
MALLYISHSDETERRARILCVQQGIDENKAEYLIRLTKITKELDKGKGHVFSYQDFTEDSLRNSDSLRRSKVRLSISDKDEGDSESSASQFSACSEPVVPTGFRVGPSSEGRVSWTQGMSKASRRRPSSWKRKVFTKANAPLNSTAPVVSPKAGSSKRKPSPLVPSNNKTSKDEPSDENAVEERCEAEDTEENQNQSEIPCEPASVWSGPITRSRLRAQEERLQEIAKIVGLGSRQGDQDKPACWFNLITLAKEPDNFKEEVKNILGIVQEGGEGSY